MSGGPAPVSDFDYELPEEQVAQVPLEPRDSARLLDALDPVSPPFDRTVRELPQLLGSGDLLVVNDSRVIPARLMLHKHSGGSVEVMLLRPAGPIDAAAATEWQALIRPARRTPAGTVLLGVQDQPVVEVLRRAEDDSERESGIHEVRLLDREAAVAVGQMPLPPYIHTELADPDRYQTVYARREGSVAAPTAGLHFTPELLEECRAAGAEIAHVDLAVGLGTFKPMTGETVEDHVMHAEYYRVPPETIEATRRARRVIAIGTTALRTLETVASGAPLEGETRLYVRGDYDFRCVDVLLTNFHLPRSSLLVLLASFAGPRWRSLYETALERRYRFLSFGDAMIVARSGR
ncbi:MAG TPA: tRNA preQ1(34) S-adenosylmethionine ribosyltransferase-isomerase QueA [Acidimicrobiales bacterium]|nr:tRNA preQ1(34) S-adenosylmethionine ribosyltransferase-isomerase QueA [Acidimicrobiales bacterium]